MSAAVTGNFAANFEGFAAGLPEVERAARRAAFERFAEAGFPTRKLEDWRYTDLGELGQQSFERNASTHADLAGYFLPNADRIVYANGHLDTKASTKPEWHDAAFIAPAHDGSSIAALNAAFSTGGLRLEGGRNEKLSKPLQVISTASTASVMSHQHHRILLGDHAEATVLLQFVGDAPARLSTHVVDIVLGAGARLNLYRLQSEAGAGSLITRIKVRQVRDSRLHALTIDAGSGLARHDFDVDLAEAGAEAEVSGLYMPSGDAHIDNHTRASHVAPHCRSRSHYRGIVGDSAHAVFNGKVIVQPGAQKTDSEQRIANLLLSRKAQVDAKPELEIYADDVKCAHGSTVGQLDETALAYLRSRGISRDVARAMLLRAFATEILDRIEWPELRTQVERSLDLPADAAVETEEDGA